MGHVYFFTGFPGVISSMLLEELIAKWAPEKIHMLVLPNMKDKKSPTLNFREWFLYGSFF